MVVAPFPADADGLRQISAPPGIDRAATLPAAWYADSTFHRHELQRVFRSDWVCAAMADELPPRRAWSAISVAGLPVLIVRDAEGDLRAFLNVCRHRASPLCETGAGGAGAVIRCPYHAWVYRLDGSLAKASGVGTPAGFDAAQFALKPVAIASWRRTVWINVADPAATFDPGPLGAAIDQFQIESFELVLAEAHLRPFNWKVLLENYSENYHTPFVHPQIDTSAREDYPMVSEGRVLYAWDRPLRPSREPSDRIRATLLPGEPGWELLAASSTERPYDVGSYLTIWPNLMINVFPDAALVMWVDPADATTTRVERRLLLAPGRSQAEAQAIVESHRLVHEQDVDICVRVQRSHTAGVDADGVLSTTEEHGVFFVHEHLRRALAAGAIESRRVDPY
jgi:phenylpropionate dioxygenase-like ring-hydroxylating dioxygenase large terminal subunit